MFASNGMFGVPATKKLPRYKLAMFHYKMGIFVHANMPFWTVIICGYCVDPQIKYILVNMYRGHVIARFV